MFTNIIRGKAHKHVLKLSKARCTRVSCASTTAITFPHGSATLRFKPGLCRSQRAAQLLVGMLVPWLAPQFVFIMFPGQDSSEELIAWVHAECADEARTRIAPLLQLPTETIDFQVAVARTIPTHASGDLLAYGYTTASETYGTTVPAAAPSARYMRLVASWQHRTRVKEGIRAPHRSRRGLARDHRVVSVRVMAYVSRGSARAAAHVAH